jgi:hypothetical protein
MSSIRLPAGQGAAHRILGRLDQVKSSGAGKWRARCPAHGSDKNTSLSIADRDGRVLLHCFGGCQTESVLAAVGLKMGDLFDHPLGEYPREHSRPWRAGDVVDLVLQEASVISVVASDIIDKRAVSIEDFSRLATAVARLNQITALVHS